MDPREVWRSKADEDLINAAQNLSVFTEEAEAIVRAELARRGLPDPPSPIGICAQCGRAIYESSPDKSCSNCGRPLDAELAARVRLQEPGAAAAGAGITDTREIRGWLILPAIGLALGTALGLISLIQGPPLYAQMAALGLGGYHLTSLVAEAVLLAFRVFVGVRFVGLRRNAPALMIALYAAQPILSGLLALIARFMGVDTLASLHGEDAFRAALIAAIWIPYFNVSKRVKATFLH